MTKIILKTIINAPITLCFDLARSIDLHKTTMKHTKEKAVAGITSGMINLNESVTWEAKHFGIKQKLTSKITKMEIPTYFRDEQTKGIFKSMQHDHVFEKINNQVVMTDIFTYETPFGIFGKLFDKIILKKYMKNLLTKRNSILKEFAENS